MESLGMLFLGLGIFAIFLVAGIPVGISLGVASVIGLFLETHNANAAINQISIITYGTLGSFSLIVLPAFILMGDPAAYIGITTDIFDAAYKVVGRLPGGIATATNFACAGFACITGSSVSTVVAMSKIAFPEMRRLGYDDRLNTGVIASASTLAIMIPPSIMLVVYAIFAEQSIGKLLLAGVVPGIFTAVSYFIVIWVWTSINHNLAPPTPKFSTKEKAESIFKALPFASMIVIIVMGILLGIWTPSEGACVSVVLVFVMGLIRRRIEGPGFIKVVRSTVVTSATVFIIIVGSLIFSKFMTISGLSDVIETSLANGAISKHIIFLIIVVIYLILGCFVEGISMMAITIPVMLPVVIAQKWDPIWFGIIVTNLTEIALITPPVAMNLFALKASVPDISMNTIIKGIVPFLIGDLVVLGFLYLFPEISLWLPHMMT